jgi:hypothetical protein
MQQRLRLGRGCRRLFVAGRYYFPQAFGGLGKFHPGGAARLSP